jgi:hypothetical protein
MMPSLCANGFLGRFYVFSCDQPGGTSSGAGGF